MRKYKIYYGFLDKEGNITRDDWGEIIWDAEVEGVNKNEAVKNFYKSENFVELPKIVDIVLVIPSIREILKELEIITFGDLKTFQREQGLDGRNWEQGLIDYYKEVYGGDKNE